MRNSKLILILFAGACLLQWIVLGGDVVTRERIQTSGVKHLFKCSGRDPVDVFRGNYIALNFDIENDTFVPDVVNESQYQYEYYATFELDSAGYSHIASYTKSKPATDDYLIIPAYYAGPDNFSFEVPFDKYFVNEDKAQEIERQYREATRANSGSETYLEVFIDKGRFAVGELVIR